MASTNHQLQPCSTGRCEIRNHGEVQPPAKYILIYQFNNGKLRDKKIVARRPACSNCAASFARNNNLPIPPHKLTLRQKLQEMKSKYPASAPLFSDDFSLPVKRDLRELVELIEVTYGL
ncbi:MAG: hypothetical protein ACJ71W_05900 [Terriglobales bacterium]